MIGNVVARRYARALFSLGKKTGGGELEAYGKSLSELAVVLEQSPALLRVLKNPIFSVEEKKGVMAKVLEKVSAAPTVANFVKLLADKERLDILPEIAADFGALLDAEKGVMRGVLVTAVPLSEAKAGEVKTKLEGQTGKKLELDFSDDAGILGGVVLKIGDMILDASLRAQLGIMKENIKRGE